MQSRILLTYLRGCYVLITEGKVQQSRIRMVTKMLNYIVCEVKDLSQL